MAHGQGTGEGAKRARERLANMGGPVGLQDAPSRQQDRRRARKTAKAQASAARFLAIKGRRVRKSKAA